MSNPVTALNTAALVLGYFVFCCLILATLWYAGAWYDEWAYRRSRRRKHDIEWDNLRAAWIFEQRKDDLERVDTDVLNFTVEQIYDYQKELRNDAA